MVPAHATPRARLLVHGMPEDRGRDVEVGPGIEQILRPKPEHPTPNRIVDLREPDVRSPANSSDKSGRLREGLRVERYPSNVQRPGSAPTFGPDHRSQELRGDPGPGRRLHHSSREDSRLFPCNAGLLRRDNHDRRGNRQGGASSHDRETLTRFSAESLSVEDWLARRRCRSCRPPRPSSRLGSR